MITKLEISGFKSFSNFSVDLAPFVVVAGLNGAGKSNLFDAISLLSDLAKMNIREAFSKQRGTALELFTQYADGKVATQMDFAVETLLDAQVRDVWGSEVELNYTRLRYELSIERKPGKSGIEGLFVRRETLKSIPRAKDQWYTTYVGTRNPHWRKSLGVESVLFISTNEREGLPTINLHQEKDSSAKTRPASALESTMLSSVSDTGFPHALALREAMRNWHLLQLDPNVLSKPSDIYNASEIMGPDGADLASTLFRIKREDPLIFNDISVELLSLIPGILQVDVNIDDKEEKYVISLKMDDGRTFSSKVFSEGTLRLLALLTLKHDEKHRGVLCFEEPENGVNPTRIAQVSDLLSELSTNFKQDPKADFPLRQVLINTHSPVLVGEVCRMDKFEKWGMLLFARQLTQIEKGSKWKHTIIAPVSVSHNDELFWEKDMNQGLRSINRVELIQYLETAKF